MSDQQQMETIRAGLRAGMEVAKFAQELVHASRALVDAVLVDEGGLPGQQGHGGLLSRETIAKAHAVERLLDGGGT